MRRLLTGLFLLLALGGVAQAAIDTYELSLIHI